MSASLLQTVKALFAPTDEQLMWRAQMEDDAEAFGALVGRWQEPIRRLCARLTSDEHKAEDLAQEVFSKLFARRKSFRQGSKFSTYLWRIALNHCYNELRRPVHRYETRLDAPDEDAGDPTDLLPGGSPNPAESLAAAEQAEVIRDAIAQLPESHRTIVILRHYENLKFREIAEVLDLPEGTVKTRMTEALNELGRRLRQPLGLRFNPPADRRARLKENLML